MSPTQEVETENTAPQSGQGLYFPPNAELPGDVGSDRLIDCVDSCSIISRVSSTKSGSDFDSDYRESPRPLAAEAHRPPPPANAATSYRVSTRRRDDHPRRPETPESAMMRATE